MTDREAMKQALEALENTTPTGFNMESDKRFYAAITALRERLAQLEQEPVAWGCNRYIEDDKGFQIGTDDPELAWGKYAPDDNGWWPLYTSPPAQRTWVGLTDKEISDLWCKVSNTDFVTTDTHVFAEAIEAKLKEKNT